MTEQAKQKKLTPKEFLFVEYYCSHGFNATQAAKHSYPAYKASHELGYKLLKKAHIAAAIAAKKAEIAKTLTWTREKASEVLLKVIAESPRHSDKVAAAKVLNSMCGFDAPLKVEHSGGIDLIKRVVVKAKD